MVRSVNTSMINYSLLRQMTVECDRTEQERQEWLERMFAMPEQLLTESWVYQGILQRGIELGYEQGIEKGREEGMLCAARQLLQAIIQTRFPELTDLAAQLLAGVTDAAALHNALIEVSATSSSERAEQAITWLYKGGGESARRADAS